MSKINAMCKVIELAAESYKRGKAEGASTVVAHDYSGLIHDLNTARRASLITRDADSIACAYFGAGDHECTGCDYFGADAPCMWLMLTDVVGRILQGEEWR